MKLIEKIQNMRSSVKFIYSM